VMPNCIIGEGCNLGQNVVVSPGVVLGRNVKVQNNVSLYEGVVCDDDVFLGPSMVFTNVVNPRSAIIRASTSTHARTWARVPASAPMPLSFVATTSVNMLSSVQEPL
jgi:UDP-2-acetamido-3-amino-2,3-dideoxy-glucuronate N-acetyltransferase